MEKPMSATRVNVDQLLADLERAGREDGFQVAAFADIRGDPLLGMVREPEKTEADAPLYVSAGVHGDEPAGAFALLDLLRAGRLPRDRRVVLCPALNPGGLRAGTRATPDAIDLNRDYTDFESAEASAHRDWIARHVPAIGLALHLHEDWEFAGFYLYEVNFGPESSRAPRILQAVREHCPIETADEIDGHPADGGLIRPATLSEQRDLEGLPEPLYLYFRYGAINYTFESPSSQPLELRRCVQTAAVLAALETAPEAASPGG